MLIPENYIIIAAARVKEEKFTCATLIAIPIDRLCDIVDAFELRGPWSEETVLEALKEALKQAAEGRQGDSEGPISDAITPLKTSGPTPMLGPALWFFKNRNHSQFEWPLEAGMVVGVDEENSRVVMQPITDEFLDWIKNRRQASWHPKRMH